LALRCKTGEEESRVVVDPELQQQRITQHTAGISTVSQAGGAIPALQSQHFNHLLLWWEERGILKKNIK